MATPQEIQQQKAAARGTPTITPVGDVPAATAKAAMPKPVPTPPAAPTAPMGSAQALTAPPAGALTNATAMTPRALPAPPNFIAGQNGVQANTPSAAWSTAPGAAPPGAAAQMTAPPVQAPNLTTSPGATTPTAYDPPMPTRGTVVPPSPTGGSSLSLTQPPAKAPLALAPQPLALEPGPATAQPAAATAPPVDPVFTRPANGGPKVDQAGNISADDFTRRAATARQADNLARITEARITAGGGNPLAGEPVATPAAAPSASAAAAAAEEGGAASKVGRNAKLLGGSKVLRSLGVGGTVLASAGIANQAYDDYATTRENGGSEGDALIAGGKTAGKGAFSLGSTLAGAEVGSALGSRVPGPPLVRGGATLLGGLAGAAVGGFGGDKALDAVAGTGQATPYRDLGPGVYQAGGTEVPMYNAQGQIAGTPTNVDVLALQRAGNSPEAAAAFDAKFGKGRAAELAQSYVPPAPSSAAAMTQAPGQPQAPVNFITPETNGAISPPDANGVSLTGAEQAMKSNAPGTAVINGRVVSADEIKALENRNVVSSDAFTNVAPGVAYSAATGGGTMTQEQAVAQRIRDMQGSNAASMLAGNPGVIPGSESSGGGIGGKRNLSSDRASTINGLMGSIRDALQSGRRRTAKILVDQLSAFDRASATDGAMARTPASAGSGKTKTAMEQMMEAAQAAKAGSDAQVSQISAEQTAQAAAIQQKLIAETDPKKRKTLERNLASITGKGAPADKITTLTIPRQVGIGEAPQNIQLPYDQSSNQILVPDGYAELLGLLGSQPQATPKK